MNLHCPACKSIMEKGNTELTLKKGRNIVVIEDVPAMICPQCGEASIDSSTSQIAYELAKREIERGVALEFCKFKVA